jgi:eukaryotic-like serine/threonine-protein kinase
VVATPCLDDNDAAEFASGSLRGTAATRVERHLAGCRDCRALVAALAPAAGEADSDIATLPRPARLPRGKRRRDVGLDVTVPRDPHEPEVAIGDTVGRYVVLARQGAGGMGVVWSAYDPQLDRKVALKLLRAGSGVESSEGRARLVREAQAIAQLAHPNVVAVYDVGTAESGEVYIAMEFVEGETLTAWLARWERPWRDVRDVFVQAGRGLAAAHAVGLLHRDFKPDNVLVGTEGRVRVTDFGLARSLITAGGDDEAAGPVALASLRMTLTATGTILGTPRYMAPEQLRGAGTDARSDQFSFCVAMYEALYGRHPLPGDTALAMAEDGARALAPPDGPVPAFIGRALTRGLDPEPSRRFPSMQTLLHVLTPRPVRTRERWLAAGLGGLLLVGAAGATLVATGSSSSAQVRPEVVQDLLDQIGELRKERDHLLDDLKKARNDAHEIAHLRNQIIERDQRIQVLVTEVANLSALPLPPQPRHDPRPPPPSGLTLAQVRAGLGTISLDGCMREWRERVPDTDLELTATVVVTPEGHSHSAAVRGTDDSVLPTCIAARLDAARFAPVGAETTVEMAIRLGGGRVTVLPRVASVRAAPEIIDPADLRPLGP